MNERTPIVFDLSEPVPITDPRIRQLRPVSALIGQDVPSFGSAVPEHFADNDILRLPTELLIYEPHRRALTEARNLAEHFKIHGQDLRDKGLTHPGTMIEAFLGPYTVLAMSDTVATTLGRVFSRDVSTFEEYRYTSRTAMHYLLGIPFYNEEAVDSAETAYLTKKGESLVENIGILREMVEGSTLEPAQKERRSRFLEAISTVAAGNSGETSPFIPIS